MSVQGGEKDWDVLQDGKVSNLQFKQREGWRNCGAGEGGSCRLRKNKFGRRKQEKTQNSWRPRNNAWYQFCAVSDLKGSIALFQRNLVGEGLFLSFYWNEAYLGDCCWKISQIACFYVMNNGKLKFKICVTHQIRLVPSAKLGWMEIYLFQSCAVWNRSEAMLCICQQSNFRLSCCTHLEITQSVLCPFPCIFAWWCHSCSHSGFYKISMLKITLVRVLMLVSIEKKYKCNR